MSRWVKHIMRMDDVVFSKSEGQRGTEKPKIGLVLKNLGVINWKQKALESYN
jgi:hypothetical protein